MAAVTVNGESVEEWLDRRREQERLARLALLEREIQVDNRQKVEMLYRGKKAIAPVAVTKKEMCAWEERHALKHSRTTSVKLGKCMYPKTRAAIIEVLHLAGEEGASITMIHECVERFDNCTYNFVRTILQKFHSKKLVARRKIGRSMFYRGNARIALLADIQRKVSPIQ